MVSGQQIRDEIEDTLDEYNSLPRLIEFLELKQCQLSNLTITSLRFLNNLKKLKVVDSNITKLSYEEDETLKNQTDVDEPDGMY